MRVLLRARGYLITLIPLVKEASIAMVMKDVKATKGDFLTDSLLKWCNTSNERGILERLHNIIPSVLMVSRKYKLEDQLALFPGLHAQHLSLTAGDKSWAWRPGLRSNHIQSTKVSTRWE